MKKLIEIIGFIWALLGVGNVLSMGWGTQGDGFLTFGLIFNMALFIIPGLILYSLGERMPR